MEVNKLLAERLMSKSVKTFAKWAERYRVMGKPYPGKWTFNYHPWLREMHNQPAHTVVGMKSAQMGFTEWLLNTTFAQIDLHGESVLYLLPTADDAIDFSAARFDPALEASPHINNMFARVRNTGLKRAGSAALYVRGTRSKSKLKSVPCRNIHFDEVDEMVQSNLPLALERASGQKDPLIKYISTPTVPEYGISEKYDESDQRHYFFKCPHCNRLIELSLANLKGDHYECLECQATIGQEEKIVALRDGIWVPQKESDIVGYYINQLYSSTITPHQLKKAVEAAETDDASAQELYNSKLGLPFVVKGGKLTDKDLNDCVRDYRCGHITSPLITIGIDVGSLFHIEVTEYHNTNDNLYDINLATKARVVDVQAVQTVAQVEQIIDRYKPKAFVIDANPERRIAYELCCKYNGIGYMCTFGDRIRGVEVRNSQVDKMIQVDRTSWLDLVMSRFRNRNIELPLDIGQEYRDHAKTQTKTYVKDNSGESRAKYVTVPTRAADHFMFARLYSELALGLAYGKGNRNI